MSLDNPWVIKCNLITGAPVMHLVLFFGLFVFTWRAWPFSSAHTELASVELVPRTLNLVKPKCLKFRRNYSPCESQQELLAHQQWLETEWNFFCDVVSRFWHQWHHSPGQGLSVTQTRGSCNILGKWAGIGKFLCAKAYAFICLSVLYCIYMQTRYPDREWCGTVQ